MLRLERLSCGYGLFRAVSELDLEVPRGTITGLIGPNGAGKSSTLMCVAGHVDLQAGRIAFDDHDIGGLPATERVRRGIAIAPEGRRLFKDLSVEDNLRVGGLIHKASLFKADREYVLSLFPRLRDRLGLLAANLSGGEQQMLSIGRALMARPKLIMIDELSLGLMPKMVDLCYDALLRLKGWHDHPAGGAEHRPRAVGGRPRVRAGIRPHRLERQCSRCAQGSRTRRRLPRVALSPVLNTSRTLPQRSLE